MKDIYTSNIRPVLPQVLAQTHLSKRAKWQIPINCVSIFRIASQLPHNRDPENEDIMLSWGVQHMTVH